MIKYSIKNNLIYIIMCLCLLFCASCSNKSLNQDNNTTFKKTISKTNTNTLKNKNDSNLLKKQYDSACNLFFNHKYEESIKLCDDILKKDNNFYKAYTTKGIALCFLNDFKNGMKNIDKCLSINPNFAYGRFNKALAYELYGFYNDALKWYDKALAIENYIWSYYGKASIYGRLGDIENTVHYLKIAINMDPSIKKHIKSEIDFNPVRNSSKFKELLQ